MGLDMITGPLMVQLSIPINVAERTWKTVKYITRP